MKVKKVLEMSKRKTGSGREIDVNTYKWTKYDEAEEQAQNLRTNQSNLQVQNSLTPQRVRSYGGVSPSPNYRSNIQTGLYQTGIQINQVKATEPISQNTPDNNELKKLVNYQRSQTVNNFQKPKTIDSQTNNHQLINSMSQRGQLTPNINRRALNPVQLPQNNLTALQIQKQQQQIEQQKIQLQQQQQLLLQQQQQQQLQQQKIQLQKQQQIIQQNQKQQQIIQLQKQQQLIQQNHMFQQQQQSQSQQKKTYCQLNDPKNPFYEQYLKLQKMTNNQTPQKTAQNAQKENIPINPVTRTHNIQPQHQNQQIYENQKSTKISVSASQPIRLEGRYSTSRSPIANNTQTPTRGYQTQLIHNSSTQKAYQSSALRQQSHQKAYALQRPNQDLINARQINQNFTGKKGENVQNGQQNGVRTIVPPPNTNQNFSDFHGQNTNYSHFIKNYSGNTYDYVPAQSSQLFQNNPHHPQ